MSEIATITDDASGLTIGLPPGWQRVAAEPALLALAVEDWDNADDVRPNLNVVVSEVGDADVAGMATATVALLLAPPSDAHVMAYDLWTSPEGVPGRRLCSAYLEDGVTVALTQWLFVSGGYGCTVTLTCGTPWLLQVEPHGDYAVAGLRLPTMMTGAR